MSGGPRHSSPACVGMRRSRSTELLSINSDVDSIARTRELTRKVSKIKPKQIRQYFKSNRSLYKLNYAKECNKFAGPISSSLRPGNNTARSKEISQRWRAISNVVSDLTGLRFEPQTSRSRDERVTVRPTGRFRQGLQSVRTYLPSG